MCGTFNVRWKCALCYFTPRPSLANFRAFLSTLLVGFYNEDVSHFSLLVGARSWQIETASLYQQGFWFYFQVVMDSTKFFRRADGCAGFGFDGRLCFQVVCVYYGYEQMWISNASLVMKKKKYDFKNGLHWQTAPAPESSDFNSFQASTGKSAMATDVTVFAMRPEGDLIAHCVWLYRGACKCAMSFDVLLEFLLASPLLTRVSLALDFFNENATQIDATRLEK